MIILKPVPNKQYDNGSYRWSHNDVIYPERTHIKLGPCPDCGKNTFNYGGGWRCVGDYCARSVNNSAGSVGSAPTWWETNINVKKVKDEWVAFLDEDKDTIAVGSTPDKAVQNLIEDSKTPQDKETDKAILKLKEKLEDLTTDLWNYEVKATKKVDKFRGDIRKLEESIEKLKIEGYKTK